MILMKAINRHSRIRYQSSIGMTHIDVARYIQAWHHQDLPYSLMKGISSPSVIR